MHNISEDDDVKRRTLENEICSPLVHIIQLINYTRHTKLRH